MSPRPASRSPSSRSSSAGIYLDEAVQRHLGQQLRALYGEPVDATVPRELTRLLDRLTKAIQARTEPVDQAFVDAILDKVPSLRAFAMSLTRKPDYAEDLVQDTLLKALSKHERFEEGTNLSAWLFTILRNSFLSHHRKARREVEDSAGAHAAMLIAYPDQEDKLMVQDLSAALDKLPQSQREAIVLVGVEGMAYEEAAAVLGVAIGTIKSRVNRARHRLAELMGLAGEEGGIEAAG